MNHPPPGVRGGTCELARDSVRRFPRARRTRISCVWFREQGRPLPLCRHCEYILRFFDTENTRTEGQR